LDVTPLKINELQDLWEYLQPVFGDQVSDVATMRGWIEQNPNVIYKVTDRDTAAAPHLQIRGYYCVLPITSVAADKL
jgi:hypothetical protein